MTTFFPWTQYWVRHGSQPFGSGLWGQDKLLVWCESLPVHLVYLCHSPNVEWPSHFWQSLGRLHTSAPFLLRRESQIWSKVGAVAESWPSLNLLILVVLGGKWLPFFLVGGIPTSEREPHWWHTNGVQNNVTRKWLPQIKWFILFLARAFAPITNDHIWSLNSQPLISCQWPPN